MLYNPPRHHVWALFALMAERGKGVSNLATRVRARPEGGLMGRGERPGELAAAPRALALRA